MDNYDMEHRFRFRHRFRHRHRHEKGMSPFLSLSLKIENVINNVSLIQKSNMNQEIEISTAYCVWCFILTPRRREINACNGCSTGCTTGDSHAHPLKGTKDTNCQSFINCQSRWRAMTNAEWHVLLYVAPIAEQ